MRLYIVLYLPPVLEECKLPLETDTAEILQEQEEEECGSEICQMIGCHIRLFPRHALEITQRSGVIPKGYVPGGLEEGLWGYGKIHCDMGGEVGVERIEGLGRVWSDSIPGSEEGYWDNPGDLDRLGISDG